MEAFLDGVMNEQLLDYNIPGAAVSVVRDGRILFAKGYGYADLATLKPVDPDHTLFYPGSVSKLFTWTAVMQLVEQGKLDLQADVNTYLTDFKIPDTFPQPITMLDLMAHTAGFDLSQNQVGNSAEEMIPMGDYLAQNMPARILGRCRQRNEGPRRSTHTPGAL